mmetsp:Transcript_81482/g.205051  ORF Transcript_81482/g.205051 Transcript_81482/m.205051 type:complete len:213 (+) Transcript_81482:1887-2525(+)
MPLDRALSLAKALALLGVLPIRPVVEHAVLRGAMVAVAGRHVVTLDVINLRALAACVVARGVADDEVEAVRWDGLQPVVALDLAHLLAPAVGAARHRALADHVVIPDAIERLHCGALVTPLDLLGIAWGTSLAIAVGVGGHHSRACALPVATCAIAPLAPRVPTAVLWGDTWLGSTSADLLHGPVARLAAIPRQCLDLPLPVALTTVASCAA